MKKQSLAGIVLGLIFLVTTIIFLMPLDNSRGKPQLAGRLWAWPSQSGHTIYNLKEEDREYREPISSGGRHSISRYITHYYSRYWLEARKLPENKSVRRVVVADLETGKDLDQPQILGPVKGGIWLWNNGMELRDPETLKVRFSQKQLAVLNPDLAKFFPDEVKNLKVSSVHEALIYKSSDLQYYAVDGETGKISPADLELFKKVKWQTTPEGGFTYVQPMGRSMGSTSVADFLLTSFRSEDSFWYALLSEEKKNDVSPWPSADSKPWGEEWRYLYRTAFKKDRPRHFQTDDDIVIEPAKIERMGELRWLNGAFLQRSTGNVWTVPDPASNLILHKLEMKRDSHWQLARIDREGEQLWSVDTGIAELYTVNDLENMVFLYGFPDYSEPTNNRPNTYVCIHAETGAVTIGKDEPLTTEEKRIKFNRFR